MMAALRNRRFLVFGGATAVCLIILAVSFVVHVRKYYALRAEQAAAERQVAELRRALEGIQVEKLEQENQALAQELSEIERSLPEREYVPTLIRQIESGAAMTRNDLIELRQGEIRKGLVASLRGAAMQQEGTGEAGTSGMSGATTKEGEQATGADASEGDAPIQSGQRYSEMDIEVRLEGTYKGAFEFIRHLGKIGKIIAVETVEIERTAGREPQPGAEAPATIKLACKAYILEPRSGFPGEITIKIL